jgi:hypothetical protein
MKQEVLKVDSREGWESIEDAIDRNEGVPDFIHVAHRDEGADGANLSRLAFRDRELRLIQDGLTNLGFYHYRVEDGTTRFVQHGALPRLWNHVKDGTYRRSEDGLVYDVELPESGRVERLVVVFSPMANDAFETSIQRFLVRTYPSLIRHLVPSTAVIRLADVGGVKGGFYIDTSYLPSNFAAVQRFIQDQCLQWEVPRENVVLYGPSKGGSGASIHGLAGDWSFVAVDPILSDEYYETEMQDLHFTTGGIYPRSKQEVVAGVVESRERRLPDARLVQSVITAPASPQKPYIERGLADCLSDLTVLSSRNEKIQDHPDVAKYTLPVQVMALNTTLSGFGLPPGSFEVS